MLDGPLAVSFKLKKIVFLGTVFLYNPLVVIGLEAAVGGVAGIFAAFQDSFLVAVICHVFSLLLLVCAAGGFAGGVLLL